jgi:hypothetical protein
MYLGNLIHKVSSAQLLSVVTTVLSQEKLFK